MPHEWPPPPPRLQCRSARRKHMTSKALAAIDWYGPRHFECYSDGDDDEAVPSPPTKRELYLPACPSSFDSRGKRFQSAGKGIVYHDSNAFENHLRTEKIGFTKEGKVRFPAKNRVDHNFIALQQHSGTLRLSSCPLPGPFKHVVKPNSAPSIIPEVEGKEKHGFDAREPFSPEVTCLGRVKIREKQGHYLDCVSSSKENPSPDVTKPSVGLLDGKQQPHHGSGKKKKSGIKRNDALKGSCLSRPRRHPSKDDADLPSNLRRRSPAVIQSDATETRRERAAALARTLTSLLEDLRSLEMEKSEYVPAVPPPNSLLLMRRFGCAEKLPEQVKKKESMPGEQVFSAGRENYGTAPQVTCAIVEKLCPLTNIKNTSSECSLWQRRALGKLTAIDTKRPIKVEVKQPRTE